MKKVNIEAIKLIRDNIDKGDELNFYINEALENFDLNDERRTVISELLSLFSSSSYKYYNVPSALLNFLEKKENYDMYIAALLKKIENDVNNYVYWFMYNKVVQNYSSEGEIEYVNFLLKKHLKLKKLYNGNDYEIKEIISEIDEMIEDTLNESSSNNLNAYYRNLGMKCFKEKNGRKRRNI